MSTRDRDDVRRLIRERMREASAGVFYGQVQTVDADRRSCTVEAEGVRYEDVALYAVEKSGPGFCFLPTSGSPVLVGRIGGSNELYVVMFSEIDALLLTIEDKTALRIDVQGITLEAGQTKLEATQGGLILSRNGYGLKDSLKEICEAIKRLTVPTGTGPSGTPVNFAEFDKAIQNLEKYLK